MKKYYIGLLLLAALTLGLTIFTVQKGMAGKQDKQTESKAKEIAEQLNDYVDDNNQIPESLDAAGARDVPATITYTKLSDERYKFCVTYKSASRGYGVGTSEVLLGALSRGAGDFEIDYPDDYEPSYLYLGYGHKEGENCQTIKPYISQQFNSFDEDFDWDAYFDSFNDLEGGSLDMQIQEQ